MDEPKSPEESAAKRIDALERRVAKLQTALLASYVPTGLLVLFTIASLAGKAHFAGRSITVTDANKAALVRLDGDRALQFFDDDHKLRLSLGLNRSGDPFIDFFDRAGAKRSSFFMAYSAPVLQFYDRERKMRSSLQLLKDKPSLQFLDTGGTLRSLLDLQQDGTPSLRFFDATGQPLAD